MGHAKAPGGQAEGRRRSGANPTQPHGTLSPASPQEAGDTPVPVYSGAGVVVGRVVGGVLAKRCRESVHMLRRPLGWACDVCSLEAAERAGARAVEIAASDTKATYWAPLSAYWEHGVPLDRGFGEQLVLPLRWWRISSPSQPGEPTVPRQLTLWGAE